VAVALEAVATGLTAPNGGTAAPGQPDRLFVTDQPGILWVIDLTTGDKTVFLDVSSRLVSLGIAGPGTFDERGLLAGAFHPDYATNGLLYTYTSEPLSGAADFSTIPGGETAHHQSVVIEWQVPDPTNPASVVDPGSARELLRIDQPQFNHDGGQLNFGPDGMLYASLGDGGGDDDEGVGHGTNGNGQDPSTVLGTVLRIDPSGSNSANGQYGIPSNNPFVGVTGFVEEIFAYGFRNPFRFSFDLPTGDLYLADVGQNDIEEIDIVTPGGNYGWPVMEGSFFFDPNGANSGFVTDLDPGGTEDLTRPIAEYDHDEGTAIIGGFVYRGSAIPGLQGEYVFGDFSRTFNNDGRLFHLDDGGKVVEAQLVSRTGLGLSLLGFGRDSDGELYLLANETGTPFGDTGVVLRIALPPPLCGPAPLPPESCRQATAGKTSLLIVDKTPDSKDLLKWTWKRGAATDVSDFADPISSAANYSFCVYDASASSQPRAEMTLLPGGTCNGKACWKTIGPTASPKGFKFKNKAADPDGIKNAKLKAGADGKAQVKITGKGDKLDLPALSLVTPVTAQLLIDHGTTIECWQQEYATAKKNQTLKFKARTRAGKSGAAGTSGPAGGGSKLPY
jgi:glucose/arabinose dehydrogenase